MLEPGVALPYGPLGTRAAFVLRFWDDGWADVGANEVADHFAPVMRDAMPQPVLRMTLWTLRQQLHPIRVGEVRMLTEHGMLLTFRDRNGAPWRMTLTVEAQPPHRIAGLLYQPAPDLDMTVPEDWQTWGEAVTATGQTRVWLGARMDEDACRPVQAHGADTRVALGSTFKLWVLHAVASAIRAGTLAWDDTVVVTDAFRSLPSGTMQDDPEGAAHTIAHAARQMIAISDNTATDLLMHRVGRDAVEASVVATGHGAAERMRPFLTTRELFLIKGVLPEALETWASLDEEGRRAWLDAHADAPLDGFRMWTTPRAIHTAEWWASPEEVCEVMRALRGMSREPGMEPLRDILSVNPGVPVQEGEPWAWMGYKGGSEPGVLTLAWWLQDRAGQDWFWMVGWEDANAPLQELVAVRLTGWGRRLLGREVEAP
jgi:hypothetical protein